MLLNLLEHLTVWIGIDFVNLNLAFEKTFINADFSETRYSQRKGVGLRLFIHYLISKNVLDGNHEL